jgi:nitronate monooxygenase
MIRTRFTELFGLEHAVMSAPMAMHTGGALAAAVSGAGGMGSFGGIHETEGPDWVRAQAALVRGQTACPFAIGFITPFLPAFAGHFEAALDARPDAIALSFADPGEWGHRVKEAGVRLICQVQTFDDAVLAVAAGADVLVAQGGEAGGHTGTMSLLPLLAGIAERYPEMPILAAGGIASGRTLAAALLAGADGGWLGTAFVATREAVEVSDEHKAAVVASDGADTVLTSVYDIAFGAPWPPGIGGRVRKDAFTQEWAGREAELRECRDNTKPSSPLYFGQSARFVDAIRSAADVVRLISASAEQFLRQRSAELLSR